MCVQLTPGQWSACPSRLRSRSFLSFRRYLLLIRWTWPPCAVPQQSRPSRRPVFIFVLFPVAAAVVVVVVVTGIVGVVSPEARVGKRSGGG